MIPYPIFIITISFLNYISSYIKNTKKQFFIYFILWILSILFFYCDFNIDYSYEIVLSFLRFKFEKYSNNFIEIIFYISFPIYLYTKIFSFYKNINIEYIFLCVFISVLIALSNNLITLFSMFELLTVFSIPLIYKHHSQELKIILEKYLFHIFIPSLIFLFPVIIYSNYFFHGKSFDIINYTFSINQTLILVLLFMLGITKTATVFNLWILYAKCAEYPVSGVLHSVSIVNSGLCFFIKVIEFLFNKSYLNQYYHLLIILPCINFFISAFLVLRSFDLKNFLIYSTINQLCLIIIVLLLPLKNSTNFAIQIAINHSYVKLILFIIISSIYIITETNNIKHIDGFLNNSSKNTVLFCILIISSYFLIGGYGSYLFYVKKNISEQLYDNNFFFLYCLIKSSSYITAIYMIRFILYIFIYGKKTQKY